MSAIADHLSNNARVSDTIFRPSIRQDLAVLQNSHGGGVQASKEVPKARRREGGATNGQAKL